MITDTEIRMKGLQVLAKDADPNYLSNFIVGRIS